MKKRTPLVFLLLVLFLSACADTGGETRLTGQVTCPKDTDPPSDAVLWLQLNELTGGVPNTLAKQSIPWPGKCPIPFEIPYDADAIHFSNTYTLLVTLETQTGQHSILAENSNPPDHVVKLIFIHHSTGENWLTDGYGDLGQTLDQNNYFVSDTNYGWGPDAIGDRTDIPNWTEWFASDQTPTYLDALFNESGQNSGYTRTLPDPGGENEIIMFKSCFPNSELDGSPNDPPGDYEDMTVAGAKYVYNTILQYFATRPDKLFVVITAPPRSGLKGFLTRDDGFEFNPLWRLI